MKKILTLVLALVMALGVLPLAGCNKDGEEGGTDYTGNETELRVGVWNGGLGYEWLNKVKTEFEKQFANVSFEEGKTGVYIEVTADKQLESATLMATGADRNDIFYTADHDLYDYINLNVPMDITDIVTEPVYDADGNLTLNATGDGWATQTTSLYDRMLPYYQEAYNLAGTKWATNDGDVSFSLLPYEDTIAGIILDYDFYEQLCQDNQLDDKMTGYKYEGDAVAMPGTWDEFFALLTLMRDRMTSGAGGVSGFMYSIDYYTPSIETAVIADVDGTDEDVTDPSKYSGIRMFDTYRGAYDFNNNGTIDEGETITSENYWKLTQTRGMEAMVQVAVRLFEHGSGGNEIYDNGVMNNPSYSTAQMARNTQKV